MALTLENESADNSSSTVSDSSSRSSTMHDMAVSSSGDGVDLSRRSMTRSDDEPQRSAVQPLKSTRASSAGEFKARIEMGKQRILISLPVKVNFNEFVRAVLHSTFVNLTEEDIKRMLHYIDNEGDVVKVPTDENFEEMKVDYFRSGPDWRDLAPLRVVLVQDNIDPLSLVMIPPHHQCPEPMPWKQGKLLGQGAYGSVHMGMKGDGTMLAVKRLDLSSDKGRHISDTYETEKSLLQRLRHTNVVKYVASKKISSSLAVIWMEYVPGGSVASILQAFGPMSEDIVRNYTRQIVQGLIYLHQHSVIHRDLKPGNILVTVSGIVKLSDFGSSLHVTSDQACASQSEDRTRGGGIGGGGGLVGTPNYIAPEVVRARTAADYSFNVDVWSLGITAIEMVTGETPFQEYSNQMALIWNIGRLSRAKPSAPSPPKPPDGMCEEGKRFIDLCLEPDPTMRPQAHALLSHEFVAQGEAQGSQSHHHLSAADGKAKKALLKRTSNVASSKNFNAAVKEDEFEDAAECSPRLSPSDATPPAHSSGVIVLPPALVETPASGMREPSQSPSRRRPPGEAYFFDVGRHIFSKVLGVVVLYSRYTRALTFENFRRRQCAATAASHSHASHACGQWRWQRWRRGDSTVVHVSDQLQNNGRPSGRPRRQHVRAQRDRILASAQRDLAPHTVIFECFDAAPQSRLARRDSVFPRKGTQWARPG
jgi:serine/threonine protein kinase